MRGEQAPDGKLGHGAAIGLDEWALGFLVIPFVPETQGVQLSDEVGAIPAAGT